MKFPLQKLATFYHDKGTNAAYAHGKNHTIYAQEALLLEEMAQRWLYRSRRNRPVEKER